MKRVIGLVTILCLTISFNLSTVAFAQDDVFGNNVEIDNNNLGNSLPKKGVSFHEGETPIETIIDEETGIVIDVFKAPEINLFDEGNWRFLGSERWVMNGNINSIQKSGIYHSTGGDFMIRIPKQSVKSVAPGQKAFLSIQLFESDPFPANDDKVAEWAVSPNTSWDMDYVVRNIDDYVDGLNGLAELYTLHSSNYTVTGNLIVSYYD